MAGGADDVPGWWIYRGSGTPHDGIDRLPPAPAWRSFTGAPPEHEDDLSEEVEGAQARRLGRQRLAAAFQAGPRVKALVNMALYLRRPLLITGPPGVGKSTLAYSVSYELKLGPVLRWPITSRSTLLDGLYRYDAIGRLQEVSLRRESAGSPSAGSPSAGSPSAGSAAAYRPPEIGRYLRLGPLGTALLPRKRPRVLLIDEIDKSDIDLPNDLLNVFEEGEFVVPELARMADTEPDIVVRTEDRDGSVELHHGEVRCAQFPLILLTSNEEREFPRALLRRFIRLEIREPDESMLASMVDAHLDEDLPIVPEDRRAIIAEFLRKREEIGHLASDQLLNALRLAALGLWGDEKDKALIKDHILRPIDKG